MASETPNPANGAAPSQTPQTSVAPPSCSDKSTAAIGKLTAASAKDRMAAITSLGWYGDPCAVLPLLQLALGDPERDVRTRAITISAGIISKHPDASDLAAFALKTYAAIMGDVKTDQIVRDYASNAFLKLNESIGLFFAAASGNKRAKFQLWVRKYKFGLIAVALGASAGGLAWHYRHKLKSGGGSPSGRSYAPTRPYSY